MLLIWWRRAGNNMRLTLVRAKAYKPGMSEDGASNSAWFNVAESDSQTINNACAWPGLQDRGLNRGTIWRWVRGLAGTDEVEIDGLTEERDNPSRRQVIRGWACCAHVHTRMCDSGGTRDRGEVPKGNLESRIEWQGLALQQFSSYLSSALQSNIVLQLVILSSFSNVWKPRSAATH